MGTQPARAPIMGAVPASKAGAEQLAYPPSWIDRLIAWVEHLPSPAWLVYTVVMAAGIVVLNAVFWVDGSLAFGSFDALISSYGIWIFYWIAAYHYLTRIGSDSLSLYRPLLEIGEAEFAALDHELATLPRWIGWVTLPLGFGLALAVAIGDPAPYGNLIPESLFPLLADSLVSGFMMATFIALLIRSLRQLRMVRRLHRRATQIDILDLEPAHAFSKLTARTGAVLIFIAVVGTISNVVSTGSAAISPLDAFLTFAVLLLAGAVFVIPITGMQNNLERQKDGELKKVNELLNAVRIKMHEDIREHQYQDVADRDAALEALLRERDLLRQVSTWPWEPRTLRGFASTLLLPIFLWVATRLLERFL